MNLDRDIVLLDIETTGIDQVEDRIIEIYIKKVIASTGQVIEWHSYFNPERPSNPKAIEKHGIVDSFLLDKPKFVDKAKEIFELIKDTDLGGYNQIKFDVPFLIEEFLRAQIVWNVSKVNMVDVFRLWQKHEARTLENAYQIFCGKKLTDAHSAKADTDATLEILQAQLVKYSLNLDQAFVDSRYDNEKNYIDVSGKLVVDENGSELINFGKYQGQRFEHILKTDPGYITWALYNNSFTRQTRLAFQLLKKKYTTVTI